MNSELALLEALENIERNGVQLKTKGLCYHIEDFVEEMTNSSNVAVSALTRFSAIAEIWIDFSGSESCPVPHCALPSIWAYMSASDLYTGEYGAKRMELLHFAADYQRASMGVKP